jgi:hypothetical protein
MMLNQHSVNKTNSFSAKGDTDTLQEMLKLTWAMDYTHSLVNIQAPSVSIKRRGFLVGEWLLAAQEWLYSINVFILLVSKFVGWLVSRYSTQLMGIISIMQPIIDMFAKTGSICD